MMRFFQGQDVLCLSLLLVIAVNFVSGQPPGSKLIIKSPERLVKELDHRDSLFGQPAYGASIEQKVYYLDDELCSLDHPIESVSSWEAPFILMISRGGCTFVQKVRTAQRLGAAAAIIADTTCQCSDANCKSEAICETLEPIMAGDGSESDILIPSMLIFKSDADPLIEELVNNTNITMEMSYNLPSPDDRVEYDLFTTPTDGVSKAFLNKWKPMAKALGAKAVFRPHMYIYDGVKSNCLSDKGENMCGNLCTNGGRYCQTDPDNGLEKGISGADVVRESLRRICIWRYYGDDGIGEIWWDYVSNFDDRCGTPDLFANEDCIRDLYASVGVLGDKIARCMVDSGGLEVDGPNSLLDYAIADQSQLGVVVIPTAFVNIAALRGTLSVEAVFGAICSAFAEGSAPEVCTNCASCQSDLGTCVESNACGLSASTVGGGSTIGSGSNTFGGGSTIGNEADNNVDSSLSGSGSDLGSGSNSTSGNNAGGGNFSNGNGNNSNGGGIPNGNSAVGSTTSGEGTNIPGGGNSSMNGNGSNSSIGGNGTSGDDTSGGSFSNVNASNQNGGVVPIGNDAVGSGTSGHGTNKPGSKLIIKRPERLVAELDHRDALFGQPPYGASIEAQVYYTDFDLCGSQGDKLEPPFILMASRGGCTFVQKVRNAQRLGAAAAIISDSNCLCSDANCVSEGGTCESSEPIMADDGSGSDISIPAMLIFKSDADPLIEELKNDVQIVMEMSFTLPSPDDRVEYDLFTTPTDDVSKSFLNTWKPMAKALGARAYFTPHMYTYDGIKSKCLSDKGENMCYTLCTNGGRYCQTDPDNDLDKGISGADLVTESLRRLCIWMHYGEDGVGEIFWDYVNNFEDLCSAPDLFANEDCIEDTYLHATVDGDKIARCMADSGGLEESRSNSILDQQIATQSQMGVVVVPTVFVNTVALRGTLSAEAVFGAICSGFAEGTAPEVCVNCATCQSDLATCVESNACTPSTVGGGGGTAGQGSKMSGGGTTGQQGDGWSDWEPNEAVSNNADDPMMVGLMMLSEVFESFGGAEICGINFEALAESSVAGEPPEQLLDSFTIDEPCTSGQEQNFLGTLERFESCSGWDIKEVIETFPSAMVGTAMRCVMKAITVKDDEAFEEIIFTECAGVLLADNPLGNFLKRILLEPGKNCGCFSILSDLPECELDVWPIPIFGSGLKTWSCLLTDVGCGFLPSLCDNELAALADGCLPEGNFNEEACKYALNRGKYDSILLSLPPPLAGMPLPDVCRQGGMNNGNPSSVVHRYDKYVQYCVKDTGFWELPEPSSNYVDHSSPPGEISGMDNSVSQQEEETTAPPTFDEALAGTKEEGIGLGAEDEEEVSLKSPKTVLEEGTISKEPSTPASSSSGGFLNGLITGAILTAMLVVSAAIYHKKHSSGRNGPPGEATDQKGLYASIELT